MAHIHFLLSLTGFKTRKHMSECVINRCATCTFPNLFILSSTQSFSHNFPTYPRLHLPRHPMTAAILREMKKETHCTCSVLSSQWDCFNTKFYIRISHYARKQSSEKSFAKAVLECKSQRRDKNKYADKPPPAEWTSDTHASHPLLLEPADSSGSQDAYCSGLDKLEQTWFQYSIVLRSRCWHNSSHRWAHPSLSSKTQLHT
jgi:hypothetical protein